MRNYMKNELLETIKVFLGLKIKEIGQGLGIAIVLVIGLSSVAALLTGILTGIGWIHLELCNFPSYGGLKHTPIIMKYIMTGGIDISTLIVILIALVMILVAGHSIYLWLRSNWGEARYQVHQRRK
jgi:hypothetical protein